MKTGKKRNSKYWRKGVFNQKLYLKDWLERHPGYNAASARRFRGRHPGYNAASARKYRERHFYSKGLTSKGKKRK